MTLASRDVTSLVDCAPPIQYSTVTILSMLRMKELVSGSLGRWAAYV